MAGWMHLLQEFMSAVHLCDMDAHIVFKDCITSSSDLINAYIGW